jgi:hypothetical protein
MSEQSIRPRIIAQATSNGEPIWVLPRTEDSYSRLLSQIAYDIHTKYGVSFMDAMSISVHALATMEIHITSMIQDAG